MIVYADNGYENINLFLLYKLDDYNLIGHNSYITTQQEQTMQSMRAKYNRMNLEEIIVQLDKIDRAIRKVTLLMKTDDDITEEDIEMLESMRAIAQVRLNTLQAK